MKIQNPWFGPLPWNRLWRSSLAAGKRSRRFSPAVPCHEAKRRSHNLYTYFADTTLANAGWTRVRRITIRLENLPQAWRGRKAVLLSDLHLGHVRNGRFLRRIVAKTMREKPDVVFVAGDLYDGTAIDTARAAEPLRELHAPQGAYFVAGNHEQFGDDSKDLRAVAGAGVPVLENEKVEADGLQIVGVPYKHATQ